MQRRQWMIWAAASAWLRPVAAYGPMRIVATWQRAGIHHVGVLRCGAERVEVESALQLPSRAHAVCTDAAGRVIVVARRPGEWLLRWAPGADAGEWHWIDAERSFNGHVLLSEDGQHLFTTETDGANGMSLVGVRHAGTLEKLAEWPTGGSDAHDLLGDGAGGLIVANGGVMLLPETGRLKRELDTMDSSIVRLDARTGHLTGQWRLADRHLSLRHLAWGPRGAGGRRLGVALQAEHHDLAERAAAPVLALFDGRTLQTCLDGRGLAGYGGDIVGTPTGFAVSCPRADAVATWHADGRWDTQHPQAKACALLTAGERGLWSGGANAVAWRDAQTGPHTLALPHQPPLQLDNHWALLAQRGAHHEFIEKGNTP